MSNGPQLYLLVDHIKLSLLERQRAISLDVEPTSQDGHISRSLDQMRDGVDALEQQQRVAESTNEQSQSSMLKDTIQDLRAKFDDLSSQFHAGNPPNTSSPPAAPRTSSDTPASLTFHASTVSRPRVPTSSFKRNPDPTSPNPAKSVRFRDNPDDPNRSNLFSSYRDDPDEQDRQQRVEAQVDMDNEQIQEYHKSVLQQQDDQLDRLGESIGRQRDLSIQIGDELDDQIQMLDDVEGHVDRHQTRLDGARKQVEKVAKRARDNKQITVILILVIILIILIIILK